MCTPFLIHFYVNGHLKIYLELGLLNHMVILCLGLKKIADLFFTAICYFFFFTFPSAVHKHKDSDLSTVTHTPTFRGCCSLSFLVFATRVFPVCSPGWSWTQQFSCLILPSARIINVSHHAHDTVSLHVWSWFSYVFKNPPGSYAQLCNPSYLENWDRKMADSMPAWVTYWDPVSKRVSLQGVWGYWSVLECSPSMHEILNPIHSPYKINKQIK